MSNLFCCGQFGCDIIEIDDNAMDYAKDERNRWVWDQHRKTGEFPTIDEQSEYIDAAYNRYRNIKAN